MASFLKNPICNAHYSHSTFNLSILNFKIEFTKNALKNSREKHIATVVKKTTLLRNHQIVTTKSQREIMRKKKQVEEEN
jgi:hypothetical protein